MSHANSLAGWNPLSWRRQVVEANLPTVQRDAQEQARSMPERDSGAKHHVAWAHPARRRGLALPQLQLVGAVR